MKEEEMNTDMKGTFRGVLVASGVIVGAMIAVSLWTWTQVAPDAKIPIHWGIDGKVNGYGSRNFLFFTPGIGLMSMLLMSILPRFEPRRGNLLRSSKAYKATWLGMLGLLLIVHLAIVFAALGREVPMTGILAVGMGVLFVVIGNYLGKVRSNFFFGVRTPWTLSSELSWNKTHRLAGRMMVGWGIVLAASGLVDGTGSSMFWLVMGGAGVLVGVAMVYSYLVWKVDPERGKAVWTRKAPGR